MERKFEQEFKELQAFFIENLPKRQLSLANFYTSFIDQPELSNLENLYREMHNLAGAAGSYKFIELAKAARKAELFINEGVQAFNCLALNEGWQAQLQQELHAVNKQIRDYIEV